jgi:hypothetical protein
VQGPCRSLQGRWPSQGRRHVVVDAALGSGQVGPLASWWPVLMSVMRSSK